MNRSSVNLGNGAVKKTGVRKRMAGGGMVKKTGVRKFRGGGLVKKMGVKKRMAGGGMVKKTGVKKKFRGGGLVKKMGVKKFRGGGMAKKPGKGQVGLKKLPKEVRNKMGYMAGGGMVKKTGVKKMAIGGIVAGAGRVIAKKIGEKGVKKLNAAEKMLKDMGKAAATATKSKTRKGRPPKSKFAKIKSRVNLGQGGPLSIAEAAAYTAGGVALGASGKDKKKKKNA